MTQPITFVTWLWTDDGYRWNDSYRAGPEHVNRLYRALQETQSGDWQLVCLTDRDPAEIECEARPVPTEHAELGGCWRRLWLFSDEAGVLGDRLVQLDLDCMIVGDLVPLILGEDADFVAWQPYDHPCGSFFSLRAGSCPQVWDTFDPRTSPAAVKEKVGTDQAWLHHVLGSERPTWNARHGILSWRKHFMGFKPRLRNPPASCRAIFFHGPFDPSMPTIQRQRPWVGRYWRNQNLQLLGA